MIIVLLFRRVKLEHFRIQLAVVRRVKFFVQFFKQSDRTSLGVLDVVSKDVDRPVGPRRVRILTRGKALRRAARTTISLRSLSCADIFDEADSRAGLYVVGVILDIFDTASSMLKISPEVSSSV